VPAEQAFDVTVREVDAPPEFDPAEAIRLRRGERLDVQLVATDPDLPTHDVRYSLDPGAPEDAAIDPVTGRLTWDVPEDQPFGQVELTVRATEVLPSGQPGTSSTVVLTVTVPMDFPADLADLALMLLNRASEDSDEPADASADGEQADEALQALAQITLSAPGDGAAPEAGAPDSPLLDEPFASSPVAGNSLFGTQLEPGAGSGGGIRGGELPEPSFQIVPPPTPAEPTGEGDDAAGAQTSAPKDDSQVQTGQPDLHVENAPELNDAAIQLLAEVTR